jgi:hypothetical protein
VRTDERVRPTAGRAEDGKPLQPEQVGDFTNVTRPIEDRPMGLKVRQTVSRPVEGDDARARCRGGRITESALKPGARVSMKVEAGFAVGLPVLAVAEASSVA